MADMGDVELSAWYLFDRMEPITNWEQRQQIAELTSITFNAARTRDPQTGRCSVPARTRNDFLVRDPEERQADANSSMVEALRKIAKPYTGKKKRRH